MNTNSTPGKRKMTEEIIYKRPNRRRCYWLFMVSKAEPCRDCLKGHMERCSVKCPDYLSVAMAEKRSQKYARASRAAKVRPNPGSILSGQSQEIRD